MKKIFSFNLYREGIKQTKLLGIVLAVITILGSALIPIISLIEYYSSEPAYRNSLWVNQVSVLDFTPVLLIFALVAPVLLSMNLFSFLNKRKASDFYHSIPATRICIYISFIASVMTWITAVITVTVAVCMLLYTISPLYIVSFSIAIYTFLSFLASAALVTGVVMLAKSITGTTITNIIIAGIIGFFPRFLIFIFGSIASEMIFIAEMDNMGILMNSKYNIPVNLIFSIFGFGESPDLSFIGGILYTFILGIIYMVFGAFIFTKRKSETAEKSAPNKFMQHVFRCLVTIPVAIMIPVIIMEDAATTGSIIIIGFICLVIYYGYELLTTKKFKNLLSATPILAVVIVFDILFGISLTLTRDITLSFTPEPSEITAANVQLDGSLYWSSYYTPKFNEFLTKEIYNNDDTLIKYISDELKNTVEIVKNKDFYLSDVMGDKELRKTYIKMKNGKTVIRKIYFNSKQRDYITNLLLSDGNYLEASTKLPELNSSSYVTMYSLEDMSNKIWELYKEEYEQLSPEEKLYHNQMKMEMPESLMKMDNYVESPSRISFYGYYKVDKFMSEYIISSKTPKTLEFVYKCLNEKNKKDMIETIDKILMGSMDEFNFSLNAASFLSGNDIDYKGVYSIYVNWYGGQFAFESSINDYSKLTEFFDIIKNSIENEVDINKPTYYINAYTYKNDNNYGGHSYYCNEYYINLTDENLNKVNELTRK